MVALVTSIACQGGLTGTSAQGIPAVPTETGVGPRTTFAVATPAGLLGLSAEGKLLGRIVDLPKGTVPAGLAAHPNGKSLYFALAQTKPDTGFGSDIYAVEVDGTGLNAVIQHEIPNVFYASPSFDTTGNALYVHRREAKEDAGHPGVYLETIDSVERVDLRTGARQKIIADAAEPAVVPSGRSMMFVHLDRGQPTGLWTASIDGSRGEPFLKTGDRFWYLQSPRISPDGREITWSSAGRSSRAPDGSRLAARGSGGGRFAHLDIPSELYVAPIDGSALRSIATTGDDVVPAWSPDGTRIAYVALATLFIVSAKDGTVIMKVQGIGFNYGDPVWIR